jgi:hypothetical protein
MAISDERLQHYAESDYKRDDAIVIDIPIIAKELISHRERTCRLENMITRDKEKLTRLESEYENLLDKRRKYVKKQNKKIKVLKRICLESYQVVSTLAFKLGIFESSVKVGEALDNLSQCKLIHDDILPFDVAGYFSPGDSYNNELRKITQGHTKLVDCDEIKDEGGFFETKGSNDLRRRPIDDLVTGNWNDEESSTVKSFEDIAARGEDRTVIRKHDIHGNIFDLISVPIDILNEVRLIIKNTKSNADSSDNCIAEKSMKFCGIRNTFSPKTEEDKQNLSDFISKLTEDYENQIINRIIHKVVSASLSNVRKPATILYTISAIELFDIVKEELDLVFGIIKGKQNDK